MLMKPHLGIHGAPVFAVFPGFAHTEDDHYDAGISRPDSRSALPPGPLRPDEATESAQRLLDAIRVGGEPQALDNRGLTPAEVQRHGPILAPARPLPNPTAPEPPKPTPVDDGPDFGM